MRRLALPVLPLLVSACAVAPAPVTPGTLLLTNSDWPAARVVAVITANPDCNVRGPAFVGEASFDLPPSATRIIHAPPGADVCWRRLQHPPWPGWSRAYLAPGRTVDSTL